MTACFFYVAPHSSKFHNQKTDLDLSACTLLSGRSLLVTGTEWSPEKTMACVDGPAKSFSVFFLVIFFLLVQNEHVHDQKASQKSLHYFKSDHHFLGLQEAPKIAFLVL
eukprot:g48521.t1